MSAYTERIPLRVTRAMGFELRMLAALERVSVAVLVRRMIDDALRSEKPGRSRHAKKFAQARQALDEMWRLAEQTAPTPPQTDDEEPARTWPAEYETEEDWIDAKKDKKKMKKKVKKEMKKADA